MGWDKAPGRCLLKFPEIRDAVFKAQVDCPF
jgi:hypothetical protein